MLHRERPGAGQGSVWRGEGAGRSSSKGRAGAGPATLDRPSCLPRTDSMASVWAALLLLLRRLTPFAHACLCGAVRHAHVQDASRCEAAAKAYSACALGAYMQQQKS